MVRLRGADGTLVYALPGDPGGPGSRPGTGLDLSNYPERTVAAPAPSVPTPPRATRTRARPSRADSPGAANSAPARRPSSDAGGSTRQRPVGIGAGRSPPRRSADRSAPRRRGPSGGSGSPARRRSTPPTLGSRRRSAAADPGPRPTGRPTTATGRPRRRVSARFTRYLKELLTSAEGSANIVVLRTPAGAAQFLASTIDHAAWPAILGTVAGDDTVLVISRDPTGGEALAAEFRQPSRGPPLTMPPRNATRPAPQRRHAAAAPSPTPPTRPRSRRHHRPADTCHLRQRPDSRSVAYAIDPNRRGRWRS